MVRSPWKFAISATASGGTRTRRRADLGRQEAFGLHAAMCRLHAEQPEQQREQPEQCARPLPWSSGPDATRR